MRAYNGVNVTVVRDPALAEIVRTMDIFLRDIGPAIVTLTASIGSGGGGGGAPTTSSYVTVAAEAGLSAERVLAVSAPITLGDAGPNTTVSIGAALATPAIVLGTAAAAGVAGSLIRSDATILAFDTTNPADLASVADDGVIALAARRDHVHRFPTSLLSVANLSTLVLTDNAVDQILTNNLGSLKVNVLGALNLNADKTSLVSGVVSIGGNPDNTNSSLLTASWTSPASSLSGTVRCWNANYSGFGGSGVNFTGATIEGYGSSAFSLTPGTGSDTTNKAYSGHLLGALINNGNGGWSEVAALLLEGPRRSISNPTVTTCGTLIIECPTIGATTQQGIIIRQRAAQQNATDRIAIDILTHNSGTNRWSARMADRLEVQSQAAQATTALLLRQLATGATAGAHVNLDSKAGDPPSPVAGDLWRNATKLKFYEGALTHDLNPQTTKGDLTVHSGTVETRVAVGTDTHVLTADAAEPTGVKWAAAPGAGGGDSVRVNGTAATDVDLEDLLPVAPTTTYAPLTGLNVRWQIDTAAAPDDVSAYVGKDLNGNWMLGFGPVASAVNFVTVHNNITGQPAALLARGTDANIDLLIGGLGSTGRVLVTPPGLLDSEAATRSMFAPLAALAFAGAMG